jgi:hypothetical protein
VFFQYFDRTPISRNRDCYGLAENIEISGRHQVFGLCQRFDHSEHGGPVRKAGTVLEESPPNWETIPHLETTCMRFNINNKENREESAGRSQQLQILPSLNSKAVFSGSAYFSCCANVSVDSNVLPGTKFSASA